MTSKLIKDINRTVRRIESLPKLSNASISRLNKKWDFEHAYNSSVLEGSKISRVEAEKIAKTVRD